MKHKRSFEVTNVTQKGKEAEKASVNLELRRSLGLVSPVNYGTIGRSVAGMWSDRLALESTMMSCIVALLVHGRNCVVQEGKHGWKAGI